MTEANRGMTTMPKTLTRLPLAFLLATSLAACATMPAEPVATTAPAASADQRAALHALFERSDAAFLARNPVAAYFRGDFSNADRLGNSFAADYHARERAAAEADLAALRAIDREGLSAEDHISWDVFAYNQQRTLEQTGPAALPFEKYLPIDHFTGFHISYPRLSSAGGVMPFATVTDYENALKRHAQVPAQIDAAIARFREGIAAGVVQPRLTVATMIEQLDTQLRLTTEQTPFWTPIAGFAAGIGAADRTRLTAGMRTAIERDIRPSLQKLRTFLADEYLPAARAAIGLNAASGGDAYYRYRIAEMTTLPLTAEEVHATGLAEVARIRCRFFSIRLELGSHQRKESLRIAGRSRLVQHIAGVGGRCLHCCQIQGSDFLGAFQRGACQRLECIGLRFKEDFAGIHGLLDVRNHSFLHFKLIRYLFSACLYCSAT